MENIEKIRHSLSHIMAEAVLEFWPKTKLGMGPAIENGFYYDFQLQKPLEEKDLAEIDINNYIINIRMSAIIYIIHNILIYIKNNILIYIKYIQIIFRYIYIISMNKHTSSSINEASFNLSNIRSGVTRSGNTFLQKSGSFTSISACSFAESTI